MRESRPMRLEKVAWGGVEAMCRKLAREIRAAGFQPDYIIGVGRGGWVPARLLSDMLGVRGLCAMGVRFYSGVGRRKGKPVITQGFPLSVEGKRLLVVDDIADSGESLLLVKKKLAGAKELRFATLHMKPGSRFRPDFFARRTGKWVAYPWDKEEMRGEKGKSF